MVLRSIGYLGTGIEGVPHDARGGVIPNDRGRVTGDDGEPITGQYAVGWIKRGPSGVIGTNKKDAAETIELLLADAEEGRLPDAAGDADSLPALLSERGVDYVEFGGWEAIDALEKSRGEPLGRPRVKITDVESMLEASKSAREGVG
jgi:ferredoxin--NADP+ reductase